MAQLRDYIVLSALEMTPNLTQGELAKALALDKTALMSQLDRLVGSGLVVRRNDPARPARPHPRSHRGGEGPAGRGGRRVRRR
jgi:DNA-binding MarR family transcriptional regulator